MFFETFSYWLVLLGTHYYYCDHFLRFSRDFYWHLFKYLASFLTAYRKIFGHSKVFKLLLKVQVRLKFLNWPSLLFKVSYPRYYWCLIFQIYIESYRYFSSSLDWAHIFPWHGVFLLEVCHQQTFHAQELSPLMKGLLVCDQFLEVF